MATNFDGKLQQLDVKNSVLNGELEEEVYKLPPGFDEVRIHGKVCKLKKSLYGLKQSPRVWLGRFMKSICQQGGKTHNLVHDIILTSDDIVEMERLKNILAVEFEIKDLGLLRYFLSVEVARNRNGISISQRTYVLDLLKETSMLGSKPTDTPINPNLKLRE